MQTQAAGCATILAHAETPSAHDRSLRCFRTDEPPGQISGAVMEPAGAVDYSTLREQFAEQKQREQNQEEGDLIHVTLKLPGDATKQLKVKAGHQVEYLKAWLKEQPDVGERGVRLLHEGREMIDPLSFMDYPDIAGAGACTVTVELL